MFMAVNSSLIRLSSYGIMCAIAVLSVVCSAVSVNATPLDATPWVLNEAIPAKDVTSILSVLGGRWYGVADAAHGVRATHEYPEEAASQLIIATNPDSRQILVHILRDHTDVSSDFLWYLENGRRITVAGPGNGYFEDASDPRHTHEVVEYPVYPRTWKIFLAVSTFLLGAISILLWSVLRR